MCGISGIYFLSHRTRSTVMRDIITSMSKCLCHRGPDDSGVWIDDEVGVALGHRRLAVIDTSPEGHQPMVSESGRYVIAYNGETKKR